MPRQRPRSSLLALVCTALFSLLLAGCQQVDEEPKPGGKRQRPPQLVETVAVASRATSHTVTRTGTLRSRREVRLFNQEEGRVAALPFYEGDLVAKGAVVARLDDTLLRAQLEKATATRKQADSDLQRLRQLKTKSMISDDVVNRADTLLQVADAEVDLLQARLGYNTIRAPFAGLISARLIEPGDVAPRFTHLLTMFDPDSLVIECTISELMMPQVSVGSEMTVRIDALGDQSYAGHVVRIHPTVDPRTRLGILEIALDTPPSGALPGQLGRITVTLPTAVRRVIPYLALRRDTQGEYVFRVADGKVQRTAVRSGLLLGDLVEILEGIEDGDPVVVRGFLGLSDGSTVRVVASAAQ